MASANNSTNFYGLCPPPFYEEELFPQTGGYILGRFCTPVGPISCCLPCPSTDWLYSDGFKHRTEIANWVNIAALILTVFLLLSFLVLPVKWTHRHYLSVCLVAGVFFMELAFLIPMAAKPAQCLNKITPNDMRSNQTCAASGAFLLFGGWAAVMWVFCRALSLHLQVCWEVVPGKKFFYSAIFFGWAIPAVGLALAFSLSGVSFRFGNVCHINHNNGLQDFWGPLLAFGAAALILQFITLGYCIHVYVRSLLDDKTTTDDSSALPQYTGSMRTVTARQAYRRVRLVIQLQWRSVAVVLLVITDITFFSVIFLSMDNSTQIDDSLLQKAKPWLLCLTVSGGNKNQCLSKARGLVKPEPIVLAVLIMLGTTGFWCLIFLGRWSMVLGWVDLIKTKLVRRHEFVSADARRLSNDPRTYEMLSSTPQPQMKSPDPAVMSPISFDKGPSSPNGDSKEYYSSTDMKPYISPVSSFSTTRPPSTRQRGREWDPRATHARGTRSPVTNTMKR